MKTYVITIRRNFPATHANKGQETNFLDAIKNGTKIHTIRKNYLLWSKRFEKINAGEACISLRYWSGLPYRSKMIEAFSFDKSHGIGLQQMALFNNSNLDDIAKNDGLSREDFDEWFKKVEKSEPLAIIHFTNFRY